MSSIDGFATATILAAEAAKRTKHNKPNGYWFHGTNSFVIDSIRKNGLLPGLKTGADAWAKKNNMALCEATLASRAPSVFLVPDYTKARYYAGLCSEMYASSMPVVLRIVFPLDWVAEIVADELDRIGWRIPKVVPPEFIQEIIG